MDWSLRAKDGAPFWAVTGCEGLHLNWETIVASAKELHPSIDAHAETHKKTTVIRWVGHVASSQPASLAAPAACGSSTPVSAGPTAPAAVDGDWELAHHQLPSIAYPPDATPRGIAEFEMFAYSVLRWRDDFLAWVRPSKALDAVLADALRTEHALERAEDRLAPGRVELERSLRSPSNAAYRAVARTLRHRVFAGGFSFIFNRDCSRLIRHEILSADFAVPKPSELPAPLAQAALAAIAAAAGGGGSSGGYLVHEKHQPLPAELAQAVQTAIGVSAAAGARPPCSWYEDRALVVLTTTGRFVFSSNGSRLRTVIEESFSAWRERNPPPRPSPPEGGGDSRAKASKASARSREMRSRVAASLARRPKGVSAPLPPLAVDSK